MVKAIEMGEMRAKNLVENSFEDGKKAGQRQAIIDLLHQLIQTNFETDAFPWLTSLNDTQL